MKVGTTLLAGVLGGFAFAVCARAAMRAIAVSAHHPLQFDISNNLGVVLASVVFGVVVALVYSPVRKYLPRGIWLRGTVAGVLLFLGFVLLLPERVAREVRPFETHLSLILITFGLSSVVLLIVIEATMTVHGRRNTQQVRNPGSDPIRRN